MGEWFWPGGRLYKGETLDHAAHRVAREELGIDVDLRDRLGVYAHFWESSAVEGTPSRDTVNVVSRAGPIDDDPTITLDDQHDDYRVHREPDDDHHTDCRRYVEDGELLGTAPWSRDPVAVADASDDRDVLRVVGACPPDRVTVDARP